MSLKSSTKTDVNTTELLLTIDGTAFAEACEKEFQRQKKNIQIKGFRKGKAPRGLIEKEFGEGVFYEGAINSLLGPELDAAIRETGLDLVDTPSVEVLSVDKE
ncbi:MAG: trigger factor family protein, partial [Ruminococcus sp.]|nr:trigger factor family protein [Ruminococcus sp.]